MFLEAVGEFNRAIDKVSECLSMYFWLTKKTSLSRIIGFTRTLEFFHRVDIEIYRELPASCFLPGLFFVLPCTDNFVKVDLRTVSFDIPPQEVGHCSAATGA